MSSNQLRTPSITVNTLHYTFKSSIFKQEQDPQTPLLKGQINAHKLSRAQLSTLEVRSGGSSTTKLEIEPHGNS